MMSGMAPYINMGSSTSVRYLLTRGVGSSLDKEVRSVEVALPEVVKDGEFGRVAMS